MTAAHDGHHRIVVAADPLALELGLRPGLAVAQALTIAPELHVMESQPDADADALLRLARWCQRTTPLVSVDAPDGLWLDVTGCTHLWGSETALLQSLVNRLTRDGLQAQAAMADTPGAAHAVARYGVLDEPVIVPVGAHLVFVSRLPVAALRMPSELVATLRRLGFERIGHLTGIPSTLLSQRFGPLPSLRLDQAYGHVREPLQPLPPEHTLQRRVAFLEPLLTTEALAIAIVALVEPVCEEMEHIGLGARHIDLLFERVDNQVAAIRIGTVRPSRDASHLVRLLSGRLDTVDPGLGVEAMRLVVPLAESLEWQQQESGGCIQDVARLIDQLANRLGGDSIYSATPVQSDLPERVVERTEPGFESPMHIPKATPIRQPPIRPLVRPKPSLTVVPSGLHYDVRKASLNVAKNDHLRLVYIRQPASDLETDPPLIEWRRSRDKPSPPQFGPVWPRRLKAPSRLLYPPRPIEALAGLPNQPPVAFTWRRHRHRVRRADGPERIYAEWWRDGRKISSIRDYYEVENESGQRFWLFREGNGLDTLTGDLSWFLHGLF